MNILVTCGGRRVSLMRAFRQAMDQLGLTGKIIAADMTAASAAFHWADAGECLPPVGRIEYIPAVLEAVRKHRVGLVVPVTDLDLRSLARQQAAFAEIGCTVMVGTEQAVLLCRDKARTNVLFGQIGLGSIKTCTLAEFRDEPFYPCFVKPVRGSASIGTARIDNEQQLRAHVATFGELLMVQEYVPGREYTVDVYRSRDGVVRCVVPRQRLAIRSGEVEKGITVRDEELISRAKRLGEALDGMWGVFCCQCRRSDSSPPRFFEINPRFGGGAPLSIAAGANLPLYLLQEVLGLPITAEIGNFTDRLMMLRHDQEIFVPVDDPTALPGYDTPIVR